MRLTNPIRAFSLTVADRVGPRVLPLVKTIATCDSSSSQQLNDWQQEKLVAMLAHTVTHVPHYKSHVGSLNSILKDNALDVLSSMPIISKTEIREGFNAFLSDDAEARHWSERSTGGSSGEPGRFAQDDNYDRWNVANKIYLKRVGGKRLAEPELRLWGSASDVIGGNEKIGIRARNWLYNRVDLNTLRMSETVMGAYAERWRKMKPVWVEAYAQSLTEFARFLLRHGITLPEPRGIVTSASPLLPEMEEAMREVFSCPIYNRYGSREVGDVACNRTDGAELKLSPWNHYVEILDDHGNPVPAGHEGRLVITTLNNFVMPLIRYDIGDHAVAGTDRFHLQKVSGRVSALFKSPDGTSVDAAYLRRQMFRAPWVRQYQIIQEDYHRLRYRVVTTDPAHPNENDKRAIEERVQAALGNSCVVLWEIVDRIEPSPSGKHFETWSNIT